MAFSHCTELEEQCVHLGIPYSAYTITGSNQSIHPDILHKVWTFLEAFSALSLSQYCYSRFSPGIGSMVISFNISIDNSSIRPSMSPLIQMNISPSQHNPLITSSHPLHPGHVKTPHPFPTSTRPDSSTAVGSNQPMHQIQISSLQTS